MLRRDSRQEILDAVHNAVSELGITEHRLLTGAGVATATLRRLRAGKDAGSATLDAIWNWIVDERERRSQAARSPEGATGTGQEPADHPEHLVANPEPHDEDDGEDLAGERRHEAW